MAEATDIIAQITEPGEDGDLRVDLNDGTTYAWDAESNLGSASYRRTILEAANVDGGTVSARARVMHQAQLVVHVIPQESLADLADAYATLKAAMATPFTLRLVLVGWDDEDPFYIDFDSFDVFPNLIDGQLPWTTGCDENWYAGTFDITALRHPLSYGAGDYL